MGKHFEKSIEAAREVAASVGAREPRTEPRTKAEIESFVKGFGLNANITRRIVEEWADDSQRARDAGWESHADSVYYDQW